MVPVDMQRVTCCAKGFGTPLVIACTTLIALVSMDLHHKPPLWHHISPFMYPLMLSVVSIILVSVTFFLWHDEAMLFVMVKACLFLQKYSVLCNFTRSLLNHIGHYTEWGIYIYMSFLCSLLVYLGLYINFPNQNFTSLSTFLFLGLYGIQWVCLSLQSPALLFCYFHHSFQHCIYFKDGISYNRVCSLVNSSS